MNQNWKPMCREAKCCWYVSDLVETSTCTCSYSENHQASIQSGDVVYFHFKCKKHVHVYRDDTMPKNADTRTR